jgi:large subunit ribosomal protein L29
MKAKEIREMPTEEILTEISKSHEKIFRMKFQAKGKDMESPGQLKALRKSIARLSTVLRERQLASAPKRSGGVERT